MRYLFCFCVFLAVATPSITAQTNDQASLLEFFETKVRPVLAENCFSCHNKDKQKGGIALDLREAVFKKSDDPLVVPGHPEKSLLMRVIEHRGEIKMPPAPKAKLSAAAISDIETWIKRGAAWPAGNVVEKATDPRKHWAFQPVKKPLIPKVEDAAWAINPIDAFVHAKLSAKGLAPNRRADARTLLRRLSYDLTGLPPTFEEIEALASGKTTYESALDRLLASPHYGERWARHWLDVARYSDTKGYVFQEERKYAYAYTYRDYVVNSLNEDLPYDRFLIEQIAADRLVALKQAQPSSQAAMGYLTLGRRFLNNIHDIIDDRIDVVTRGMLGLTVTCARCHDHKYDPIAARDYYGLYGVFSSSIEPKDLPLLGEPAQTPEYLAFRKTLAGLEKAVADYETKYKKELSEKNRKNRDELKALQRKVDAFKATSSAAPPRGMVLVDRPNPGDARVLLRGNPNNPGPVVPRQFLPILANEKATRFKDGSGRLELARAVADAKNPLTARVFVNRVWMHHFGAPLVATPSDFGLRSDPPSHPELLDYLAWRFMEDGWSIKKLHRLIVTSKTYQLSSAENAKALAIDPDNRLLARANRRRLEFEPLRDSLLAVAGNLDRRMGGAPVDITKAPWATRRTLYGFIDRQNLPGVFRTFDFANPDSSAPMRFQTTVPQQALFMMNHPFVLQQAQVLLKRDNLSVMDPTERIQRLHSVIYGRTADADEVRIGREFVKSAGPTAWVQYTQALLMANEFAFLD